MAVEKIVIPDFGDVQDITVVEVYIKPGDQVEVESPLIALESEKAVMDIPSPFAGVIKAVWVSEDDSVKSGELIAEIEVTGDAAQPAGSMKESERPAVAEHVKQQVQVGRPERDSVIEKIVIPDFGDVQDITVVEVYIKPGDRVEVESPLIALESEKAVMDIPSPFAGVITAVQVREADQVRSGGLIAEIEVVGDLAQSAGAAKEAGPVTVAVKEKAGEEKTAKVSAKMAADKVAVQPVIAEEPVEAGVAFHATPSVRAYARELGVELGLVSATGPKGRITREDVQQVVKTAMQSDSGPAVAGQPPLEDFSVYGTTEEMMLGRIKKISGPHLQRSWQAIPHVTHFDEADVTELEQFRQQLNNEAGAGGIRYSPLIFVIRAVTAALKRFPTFNSSLDVAGGKLLLKKFYNIGIAVDTPNGLVVPVVKQADQRGLNEIATELVRLSTAAREGKLAIDDLQGATFTISSLGGIGGTGFTPIINSPQVAILGLSRSSVRPVWSEQQQQFLPRNMLPFSLSYDHRVIDGAEAARFCRHLARLMEDLRRSLL